MTTNSFSNIETLRLLRLLHQTNSLSQSAAAMNISVSKASRLLSEARLVFRDPLFVRSGITLTPTAFFQDIASDIGSVLENLDRLTRRAVFDPEDINRTYRLACLDCVFETIVMPAIQRCQAEAPNLKFEIQPLSQTTMSDLNAGLLQFFLFGSSNVVVSGNLHSLTLMSSPYDLLLRKDHPLAKGWLETGVLSESLLRKSTFLGFSAPFTFNYDRQDILDQLEAESVIQLPYSAALVSMVVTRNAVTYIPHIYGEDVCQRTPDLMTIPFGNRTKYRWQPTLFWHSRLNHDPAAQWIRSMMVLTASDLIKAHELPHVTLNHDAIQSAADILRGKWKIE